MLLRMICLVVVALATGFAFSEENKISHCPCYEEYPHEEEYFPCEKIYVSAGDLFFNENEIYVSLPGGYIKTSAIHSDRKGFYLQDFKRQGNCAKGQWYCETCDTCNENYLIWCKTCHKR